MKRGRSTFRWLSNLSLKKKAAKLPLLSSSAADIDPDDRDRPSDLKMMERLKDDPNIVSPASSTLSLPSSISTSFTLSSTSPSSSSTTSASSKRIQSTQEPSSSSRFVPSVEYDLPKLLRDVLRRTPSSSSSGAAEWKNDQHVTRYFSRLGWSVVGVHADGNCLFRALSDQLYGDERYHLEIRRRVVDFMAQERDVFAPFLAQADHPCPTSPTSVSSPSPTFSSCPPSEETLEQYCRRMGRNGVWGGNPELFATAKLFNTHIVIHQGPNRRVRIENDVGAASSNSHAQSTCKILHLLYKDNHYDSLHISEQEKAKEQELLRQQQQEQSETSKSNTSPSLAMDTSQCEDAVAQPSSTDLQPARGEEIEIMMVVKKPMRVSFAGGKQYRASTGSTLPDGERASTISSTSSVSEITVIDSEPAVVFANRLSFHRGRQLATAC